MQEISRSKDEGGLHFFANKVRIALLREKSPLPKETNIFDIFEKERQLLTLAFKILSGDMVTKKIFKTFQKGTHFVHFSYSQNI